MYTAARSPKSWSRRSYGTTATARPTPLSSNEKPFDKAVDAPMVAVKASPGKYTWYMRNYVDKNVASFGYTSWGGDRMDEYFS